MGKKIEARLESPVEQKPSEAVARRIREAEERLVALAEEICRVDESFHVEAGADSLDAAALNALWARRKAALEEKDVLSRRVVALREKLTEVERAEAVDRVAEIGTEQIHLASEADAACVEFRDTCADLLATVEKLHGILRTRSELSAEVGFWAVKYDFPRPSLPPLAAIVGRDVLRTVEEALGRLSSTTTAASQWRTKTQELKTARATQRESEPPRPLVTTQLVMTRPEEEEQTRASQNAPVMSNFVLDASRPFPVRL